MWEESPLFLLCLLIEEYPLYEDQCIYYVQHQGD